MEIEFRSAGPDGGDIEVVADGQCVGKLYRPKHYKNYQMDTALIRACGFSQFGVRLTYRNCQRSPSYLGTLKSSIAAGLHSKPSPPPGLPPEPKLKRPQIVR